MPAIESKAEREKRYAQRDVLDKLGIKQGMSVAAFGWKAPWRLLVRVRARTGRRLVSRSARPDVVLYWPENANSLRTVLLALRHEISDKGAIWVISVKKCGTPYLPDSLLIPAGIVAGLVDNKVCSVSATHSALRFVVRRIDRTGN